MAYSSSQKYSALQAKGETIEMRWLNNHHLYVLYVHMYTVIIL